MKCYPSIAKAIGLMIICFLLLGACFYCTTLPELEPRVAGWVGLLFFSFCLLAIVMQLIRGGPLVILDEEGLTDLRSFQLIPWSEIISLQIISLHSNRFLCVEVREAGEYLARLPTWKRLASRANPALGFPPIAISFIGLTPSLEQAWAYLAQTHPELLA